MRQQGLVGIDLGTGSVRVVVTDLSCALLATAERPYEVAHPHPGWSETDP